MRITKNPNKEKYEQATEEVKNNGGYRLEADPKDLTNKCPCADFIEGDKLGECFCGRYIKVEL